MKKLQACAGSLLLALLGGCAADDPVAGGSSEVDNPILVAFVDSSGASLSASGSLSIYLADQNPAQNPDPILQKQVTGLSSVRLSSRDFTQGLYTDSARTYNLLLIGNDSVGALLLNLTYNPVTGKYTFDSVGVSEVHLPLVPLVNYTASLDVANDSGVVRVIIPGSPFQTVLVDSGFVIEGVPRGAFPLHVITGDGKERPLAPASDSGGEKQHHIDSAAPPISRPPPPPPPDSLTALAGNDRSIPASGGPGGTDFSLFGSVRGINPEDHRLAVLWRQLSPGPQGAKALIENPASLKTRVVFPRPGAYQFVLSVAFGSQSDEDTVVIGVQAPPEKAAFIEPTAGDSVFSGLPFEAFWQDPKFETLSLQFSNDSGETWRTIDSEIVSIRGLNKRVWVPGTADTTSNGLLRLLDSNGTEVALSGRFPLVNRTPPAGKTGQGQAASVDKRKDDGPGGPPEDITARKGTPSLPPARDRGPAPRRPAGNPPQNNGDPQPPRGP